MPGIERRAQGAPRIACGRLDPDLFKRAFPQKSTVGHAVESDAAGKAKVFIAGDFVNMPPDLEHDLLGHGLDGTREVHVHLAHLAFRLPWSAAEEGVELRVGHGETGAVVEVFHVEPERTVFFDIDELVVDEIHVNGTP